MVAWRPANCLVTLKSQWQAAHPGAANPGFIGDAEHASRTSDHNPWVDDPASPTNVVTAGDFYHEPHKGADAYALAERLKAKKDPRVKYVISRRRIWSLARDDEGWRPYNGPNPHTGHTHVSVSSTKSRYDDTRLWDLGGSTPPKGGTVTAQDPEDRDEYFTHLHVKDHAGEIVKAMRALGVVVPKEAEAPVGAKGRSGDPYFAHLWIKHAEWLFAWYRRELVARGVKS